MKKDRITSVRVLIVDTVPMIADSLAASLENTSLFTTAVCCDYSHCLATFSTFDPAITLIMMYHDTFDAVLAACTEISGAANTTMIVIIAPRRVVEVEGLMLTAIEHGADGVLIREDLNLEQLITALSDLQAGRSLIDVGQLRDALATRAITPNNDTTNELLTPREREVAILLVDGLSTGEIALSLSISERTVQTHISNILTKLDVRSRVEAAIRLYDWRRQSSSTQQSTIN